MSITSENYINTWTDSQVDFRAELPTQKEKDDYKIVLGRNVYSGHHNGLTVWLDVETWDYGYTPATGTDHIYLLSLQTRDLRLIQIVVFVLYKFLI